VTISRALVLSAINHDLRAITRSRPEPGEGDVLIAVRAAGICHSDEHYRAGRSASLRTPRILGHEAAGEIIAVGADVPASRIGERVCVHYVVSCGRCGACTRDREQFCEQYEMVGVHRDGGYADHLVVPSVNAMTLPARVSFAEGAVLMCAGATALHALHRGRFRVGESVAIIGAGGIGMFGVRLAKALGAATVIAVDRDSAKLAAAERAGAVAIDGGAADVVDRIRGATRAAGVDVALDCVGLGETTQLALAALGVHGRAVVVGLAGAPVAIHTYQSLLAQETELMGSNDHLRSEIEELLALAASGRLSLGDGALREVPLDAAAVNAALADLRAYRSPVRTVITP
jgi:2-desacetyl-2-hydroxyethyl bacteriochlorophyllide A dehydrogenase